MLLGQIVHVATGAVEHLLSMTRYEQVQKQVAVSLLVVGLVVLPVRIWTLGAFGFAAGCRRRPSLRASRCGHGTVQRNPGGDVRALPAHLSFGQCHPECANAPVDVTGDARSGLLLPCQSFQQIQPEECCQ